MNNSIAKQPMKRIRVFATVRDDVEEWIQKQVETGKFRNRSHALEYAILELMKQEKKRKTKLFHTLKYLWIFR